MIHQFMSINKIYFTEVLDTVIIKNNNNKDNFIKIFLTPNATDASFIPGLNIYINTTFLWLHVFKKIL